MSKDEQGRWICSFCQRDRDEVDYMIDGQSGNICSECVQECIEILGEAGIVSQQTLNDLQLRFKRVASVQRDDRCIFLSSLTEQWDSILGKHLIKAAASAGMSIDRSEDIFGPDGIAAETWTSLTTSAIVIADVTGRNPSVMYWIGMALVLGKEIVVITQDRDAVPRDLRSYICIPYKCTAKGFSVLEKKLAKILANAKATSACHEGTCRECLERIDAEEESDDKPVTIH